MSNASRSTHDGTTHKIKINGMRKKIIYIVWHFFGWKQNPYYSDRWYLRGDICAMILSRTTRRKERTIRSLRQPPPCSLSLSLPLSFTLSLFYLNIFFVRGLHFAAPVGSTSCDAEIFLRKFIMITKKKNIEYKMTQHRPTITTTITTTITIVNQTFILSSVSDKSFSSSFFSFSFSSFLFYISRNGTGG